MILVFTKPTTRASTFTIMSVRDDGNTTTRSDPLPASNPANRAAAWLITEAVYITDSVISYILSPLVLAMKHHSLMVLLNVLEVMLVGVTVWRRDVV